MSKDKKTGLVSRLKSHPSPPAAESVLVPEQTKPVQRPVSVLTPEYMVSDDKSASIIQFEMPIELRHKLPEIQSEASPFATPLSLQKVIELVVCELSQSEILCDRLINHIGRNAVLPKSKRTSCQFTANLVSYLESVLNVPAKKAFSYVSHWMLSDWSFIRSQLTYKGFKQ